jgi:hypothetical protein
MAIPDFVDGRLPPGLHPCTWDELHGRFGDGERRRDLIGMLRGFVEIARDCGFAGVAIGGSFPTDAVRPGDLDLLFITPKGLDRDNLRAKCAELLVNDAAFKRRTGHDCLNCPDDAETIERLGLALGYDIRTGTDRGVLVMRF